MTGSCINGQVAPARVQQRPVLGGRRRAAIAAIASTATVIFLASFVFALLGALPLLLAAELLFALWYRRQRAVFERWRPQPPPHDADALFDRFIAAAPQLSQYLPFEPILRRWFGDVPIEDIKMGNLAELMAYGFWYARRDALVADGRWPAAEAMAARAAAAWGCTLQPGFNERLEFMAHLQDGLKARYRPLVFYIATEALAVPRHLALWAGGFRRHRRNGMTCYTYGMPGRPPAGAPPAPAAPAAGGAAGGAGAATPEAAPGGAGDAADPKLPIVFLHGLGVGLLPYIGFLKRMATLGHPIICVEMRHLAMKLCTAVPCVDATIDQLLAVLSGHGLGEGTPLCVVGHSFGTLISSRLMQLHSARVRAAALLDPVCFLVFSGHLLHRFVYSTPDGFTNGLVMRDLHTSVAVQRPFYWSLLHLWPDQLPGHSLAVVSGRDGLLPAPAVLRQLDGHPGAEVLHHPEHNHADFLGDREWQREVVAGIGRLLDRAGSRPEESAAGSANGARLAAAVAVAGDAVAIAVQSDAKAPLEICGDQAAEAVPRRLSIAADASSVVLELAEGGCCSSAARKATAMFLT